MRRRTAVDEHGVEGVVAEEFAVLDRAGRLQLPRGFTDALAMRDRVRLDLEADHIGVWPTDARIPDAPQRDPERRDRGEGQVSTAYLDVHEVHRTFRTGASEVHALRGVSLAAAPGELLAVRGRSGSGKTTLLNVIGGLDRPDDGPRGARRRRGDGHGRRELLGLRRGTVAYVFQSFGLVPILTARENVGIPLAAQRGRAGQSARTGWRRPWSTSASRGTSTSGPGELSGGQQQRVALARALAARPGLLLADEPTGQLDSETGREIMTLIARLAKEEIMTTVVTTHDPVLLSIADRVVELVDGHLVGTA